MTRRGVLRASISLALTATLPLLPTRAGAQSGWAIRKRRLPVRGLNMAYYEAGEGDPIVFLHGNPTSSYLWRHIIPHVQHLGRCIAPDMIGMGDSDPLPDSGPGRYTFSNHRDYLFELFEFLGLERDVVFVVHDWGAALGFSWAQRHPDRVKGIAYSEAILRHPEHPTPEPTSGPFALYRSPDGERAVLRDNMFLEQQFIGSVDLYLSAEDKAEYRRPYLEPGERRRPMLTWPRELPLGGEPPVNDALILSYTQWLQTDREIPKLFIRADPGAIFARAETLALARSFQNQREVTVYGGHFVQEVSPDAIGRALAAWISRLV
jgi:haloalkane dehalogenase